MIIRARAQKALPMLIPALAAALSVLGGEVGECGGGFALVVVAGLVVLAAVVVIAALVDFGAGDAVDDTFVE